MGELDWDADPHCGSRGRRGAPLRSVRRRGRGRRRERRLREVLGGRRSCAVLAHGRPGLEADGHRRPLRAEPGRRHPGQGAARPRHRERDEGGYPVVLAVYPYPPRELEAGLGSPSLFASYVGVLASIYPQVRQFVIGNEPNQPAFWRPQFDGSGNNASAAAFGPYLAAAYDILKAVDPTLSVLGVGLSPRGNDRPDGEEQHLDVARALPPRARRVVPAERANAAAHGRLQLPPVSQRGHGPARARLPVAERRLREPRPREAGAVGRLRRHRAADDARWARSCTSTRWAGRSTREGARATTGARTSRSRTRRPRLRSTGSLIREAACDPDVASVSFFGFRDDGLRTGFQAGLERADGSVRPAEAAVQAAIARAVRAGSVRVAPRGSTSSARRSRCPEARRADGARGRRGGRERAGVRARAGDLSSPRSHAVGPSPFPVSTRSTWASGRPRGRRAASRSRCASPRSRTEPGTRSSCGRRC